MTAPLVIEDLTVVYPNGHRALEGLDLRVGEGKRCAVVGRSGSGKTTLVRAVLGLLPPGTHTTGSVRVGGREVLDAPEPMLRELRGLVVGYVPQDPFAACDPLRTVGHHVREAWAAHRRRPPASAITDALRAVAIDDPERRARHHPHQWSGGMLQRATIVAGTAHAPLLTLADEPTSALDAELADEVLDLICRRGSALLLISHDLALIARHAHKVLMLDQGRTVGHGPTATLLRASTTAMTPPPGAATTPRPRAVPPRSGSIVAEVRGITRRYGNGAASVTAVDNVTLRLHAGEIIGVVGRSGSGKSTLAHLLAGMERPDSGTVHLDGRDAWTGRRTLRPGFVMPIFQDPMTTLDRRWPLWRTLTEPLLARGDRLPRAHRRDHAAQALAGVGLADIDIDRLPGSLSLGQAQRVAIARALAAQPALLIADEPTASLDVTAATAISAVLRRIADEGTALLVVSHDEARLSSYADRIVRMTDGRLTDGGTHAHAAAG
ncbi:ABC transporter ATP-binding protein [Amycolatopsis benzoatilytica]|uniref:ABC transporter ATP-binding protein n=1 Tax=Amycolatopsis benzoatilytica TaxID=346045 RepID=UPI00035C41F8|nr:ATP-binding cassette domain-containing protein [Amycolatopsis benzoatilytica]